MAEYEDFDLDRSISRAWSSFQARLGDHLVAMTDRDSLVITVLASEEPEDGATPYVQFAGFGGEHLRAEVAGNRYLAPAYCLDQEHEEWLVDQGWKPPEEHNFYVHMPTVHGDRMAVMAVRALRDAFDVPHPAFLGTYDDADADRLGLTAPPADPAAEPSTEPLAVLPESSEHLSELVDLALVEVFGQAPEHDEDGDIPVLRNSSLLFIRVHDDEPLVELFSIVVSDVQALDAARVEVGILNRDLKFIKFVVVEDRVLAHVQIPCYPFAPMILRSMLALMSETLDEIDDDLATRTGGRRALEPRDLSDVAPDESGAADDEEMADEPEDKGLHTALLTLIQLDADGEGNLDPDMVADVCGRDRELILELLHATAQEEISWRQSQEAAVLLGDEDEARGCETELRAWAQTTKDLRRALKLVARQRRSD